MDDTEIKKAIGENEANDYILSPKNHIEIYQKSLPNLSKLLSNSEVQFLADEYQILDDEAIQAQTRFKKISAYTRLFIFLTAFFSTTMLIAGSLNGMAYFDKHLVALPENLLKLSTISSIVCSAISASMIMIIKNGKLLEKWMSKRAEAEEYRLEYFKVIASDKNLTTPQDHLTVLEYFRRYQLDMQINFFTERAKELEKKSNKAIISIAILSGLVILINELTFVSGIEWTSIATLAIIVQAYAFMINNKELNDQNGKNADRYSKIGLALTKLRSQIDHVKQAISASNFSVLSSYVQAIQEPLYEENKQWLEVMSTSSLALDDLEKHLESYKKSKEKE